MEVNLIDFIITNLKKSHKQAKSLLSKEQILVNGRVETKYNYQVKENDDISIKNAIETEYWDIPILYEDSNIVVVNKPSGLLTISTTKEKQNTLYTFVSKHVKEKQKQAKIFIVHRLDKDTSGIVLFAKNEKVKNLYQTDWEDLVSYRGYIAIIEGSLEKKEDTITLFLEENKQFQMYVSRKGQKAITKYKVLKENKKYSKLEIELLTGRKNQIRVTFAHLGHPIIGDDKYGAKKISNMKLGLHAYKLIVTNPLTKKEMIFSSPLPTQFKKFI